MHCRCQSVICEQQSFKEKVFFGSEGMQSKNCKFHIWENLSEIIWNLSWNDIPEGSGQNHTNLSQAKRQKCETKPTDVTHKTTCSVSFIHALSAVNTNVAWRLCYILWTNLYNICISVLSSDIIPTSFVNTFITKTMSKNCSVHCFPDFPGSIVLFKVRTLCPFVLLLRVVLRQMSMKHRWNKAHSGILRSSTFSGGRTRGCPCVRAPNEDLY